MTNEEYELLIELGEKKGFQNCMHKILMKDWQTREDLLNIFEEWNNEL